MCLQECREEKKRRKEIKTKGGAYWLIWQVGNGGRENVTLLSENHPLQPQEQHEKKITLVRFAPREVRQLTRIFVKSRKLPIAAAKKSIPSILGHDAGWKN